MKERWKSGKMKAAVHWTQTDEGKTKISKSKKGIKLSELAKFRMSKAAAKRIIEGRHLVHRGKGGIRNDIGFYVRSTWEANFARVLKYQQKDFEYEPRAFPLKSGKFYIPDFKVDDCYYEVKGYMTNEANKKLTEFYEQYPNIQLKIVGPPEYNELRSVYGGLINWE
jgi:hypothetical protein